MELNLFGKYDTKVEPSRQLLSPDQVTVQWNALQTNAKGCIIAEIFTNSFYLILIVNNSKSK